MTARVLIRTVQAEDIPGIISLSQRVYSGPPWSETQLQSHLRVFPEGQFVAIDPSGTVVGYAASLIIFWDDYDPMSSWRDFTDGGMFTNHDPVNGRTLYAAEVMVDPTLRSRGIGGRLYTARKQLARRLALPRIRAGARLRGYHRHADRMSAEEYVIRVVRGELRDPTLSFQLRQGFDVIAVVPGYLRYDPESLGWAALIEWLNARVATEADRLKQDPRFRRAHASAEGR